jgi:TetR/AcrR family transcriptional regulator, transcriptional repressor of aconitase
MNVSRTIVLYSGDMPKVTEEHRVARRHEIARAALRLFARKGFQATSMSDIIAESGLSAGAIYGHYKSKDELIQTAISELLDLPLAGVDEAKHSTPMQAPGALVGVFLSRLEAGVGDLGILVQVWAQAAVDDAMREPTDRIGDRLRGVFEDYLREWYMREAGANATDADQGAREFAPLYVGMLQGFILQHTIFESFDEHAYLAGAAALLPALPTRASPPGAPIA